MFFDRCKLEDEILDAGVQQHAGICHDAWLGGMLAAPREQLPRLSSHTRASSPPQNWSLNTQHLLTPEKKNTLDQAAAIRPATSRPPS